MIISKQDWVGKRIELINMPDDPNPIPSGTKGTVKNITALPKNEYQVSVDWDNGRKLHLILPYDQIRFI